MFVLLEHTPRAPADWPGEASVRHWDLLIEVPGCERLPTWRLACNPLETAGETPAERSADHRRVYLDFEGEISGGRGTVRRIDRGEAAVERIMGDELAVVLKGVRLHGSFEVARNLQGSLVFRAAPARATRTSAD